MDKNDFAIIQPTTEAPVVVRKRILYPHYLAEVIISVPRAFGRARRFKLFLLADGCTGKVLRCDSWPALQTAASAYETVTMRVNSSEAETLIRDYAKKKIARRYMTYWQPDIEITHFQMVYKIFWMTSAKCAIDSLTAKKLEFA